MKWLHSAAHVQLTRVQEMVLYNSKPCNLLNCMCLVCLPHCVLLVCCCCRCRTHTTAHTTTHTQTTWAACPQCSPAYVASTGATHTAWRGTLAASQTSSRERCVLCHTPTKILGTTLAAPHILTHAYSVLVVICCLTLAVRTYSHFFFLWFRCEEPEGFASIPGLGPVKAKRLFDTFNQPFRRTLTAAAAAAGAGGGGSGSSQQQQQQGVGAAPPSSQQQAQAANTGSAEQQQQREQQEEVEGEGEEQQESEDMEGLAALAELEAQLHSTQQQQQQGAVDAAAEGGDPDGGGAGEEQEGAGEYDAAAEGDVDLVEGGSYVEEDYLASFGGDGGYDDDGLVDEEL